MKAATNQIGAGKELTGLRCPILLLPLRHDLELGVWQWPLQLQRLGHLSFEPQVDLPWRRQDDRHRFGMDRRDDSVGFGRQEAEQLVLPL